MDTNPIISLLRNRLYNDVDELWGQEDEINQNGESSNESNKDDSKIQNEKKFSVIPPPHPLLPKSLFPTEPVRSGGPIQFLKVTYAKAGSNLLFERQCADDKSWEIKELEQNVYTKGKRPFKTIFTQDLRNCEVNPIVYSRFSKTEYNPNEKVPEEPWTSCIINIK